MAFNIATTPAPSTFAQSNALKNLASGSNLNLVSQLFAGKTPAATTPAAVSSAANVKSPTAPQTAQQPTYAPGGHAIIPTGGTPGTSQTAAPATYTTPSGGSYNTGTNAFTPAPATPPTFPGIIGNLAQTSAAGNESGQNAESNLMNTSQQSSPAATQAQAATVAAANLNPALAANAENIAQNYSGQISDVAKNAAAGGVGMLTSGALNPIALGRAGAIESQAAQEQSALAAAEQQALSGNAQALTAANQQATAETAAGNLANSQQANIQSGETSAGNIANTAQSNIQSGLTSAAGYIQPSGSYPFVFNPATGTFTQGGTAGGTSGSVGLSLDPSQDISSAVQAIRANPSSYNSWVSAITSGYGANGSTITGQLNGALLNAGLNPTNLAAQSTGAASNVSTQTTTPTQTASMGYTNAVQNYSSANASYQTVTAQGNTLQQTMQTTGINTNPQFVNTPINNLANQLGSANYTSFASALTETQQAYETLLGAVGAATPTINGQAATSLLTTNSTPAQISAALSQLQTAAYNKLLPMYNLIGTYQNQLQNGNATAPTSGGTTGGNTQTVGGITFTQNAQGQWIASS